MPQHFASALVTGASSGIGADIARVLASRGTSLTLVARRTDRLEELAGELRGRVDVAVVAADLATEDGTARVAARLAERPVDLLVNNAGVGESGALPEASAETELRMVAVNVGALVQLTLAALPGMVARGHGGILNVSSLAGDQPLKGGATYAATKSFVTTWTESLAADVRGTGVHVTVLKPGFTYTEMTDGHAPSPQSLQGRLVWLQSPDVARAAVEAVESGRLVCVPGATWKAVSGLVTGLPRPLVRAVTSRLSTI